MHTSGECLCHIVPTDAMVDNFGGKHTTQKKTIFFQQPTYNRPIVLPRSDAASNCLVRPEKILAGACRALSSDLVMWSVRGETAETTHHHLQQSGFLFAFSGSCWKIERWRELCDVKTRRTIFQSCFVFLWRNQSLFPHLTIRISTIAYRPLQCTIKLIFQLLSLMRVKIPATHPPPHRDQFTRHSQSIGILSIHNTHKFRT